MSGAPEQPDPSEPDLSDPRVGTDDELLSRVRDIWDHSPGGEEK